MAPANNKGRRENENDQPIPEGWQTKRAPQLRSWGRRASNEVREERSSLGERHRIERKDVGRLKEKNWHLQVMAVGVGSPG